MEIKKFKNRPNIEHKIGDRSIFESRSVAVVGVIFAKIKAEKIGDYDKLYVLAEKRSATMMDSPGKWCVPCGYLDYNENGSEAMLREVYEETGLYLPDYEKQLLNKVDSLQPFYVRTDPEENRQNVALSYCFVYDFTEIGLPEVESFKNSEIAQLKWIEIGELYFSNGYDFAFSHDKRIFMAIDKFDKYLK